MGLTVEIVPNNLQMKTHVSEREMGLMRTNPVGVSNNNCHCPTGHLLSAYHVPGIVINSLHVPLYTMLTLH